jgi:hypothetical protein
MRYSEIIKRLYGSNIDEIIQILQKSVYSTSLNKKDEDVFVIHTGFTFLTHKGKEMEILIAFSKTSNEITIIRQSRATWNYGNFPLINGLKHSLNGINKYIDKYYHEIVMVTETENDYELYEYEIKDDLEKFRTGNIKTVEDASSENILSLKITNKEGEFFEYDFKRKYSQKIYMDGHSFSKYQPLKNNDDYVDHGRGGSTYEDYLRDDYGDDAATSYWNTE